ncbi:MAG: LysR substrate-binding domain-containing protein [Granulosicoccus sp.]
MRFIQLKAFHHVATLGGFSRAAQALHVTQPAVSDQVRKLEAEYDIKLFDRNKKQVVVTASGRKLLEITHRLFEVEQRAFEFLSESRDIHTGTLRIVADSAHHMTQVLAQFRREFPGVFISVKSGNSDKVIDQLNRYEADIGVLGNIPEDTNHDIVTWDSTPIIAFAPSGSDYSARKSVSFKELCRWPLVMRERGSRTRAKIEEQAGIAALTLNISIEAEGREAVRQIVAAGGGVGIVSQAEFVESPDLQHISIRDAKLTMEEAIVCLRERSHNPLINRFMQLARERSRE